jgi:hypothetical protein
MLKYKKSLTGRGGIMALNQIDEEYFSAIAASSNPSFQVTGKKPPAPEFKR